MAPVKKGRQSGRPLSIVYVLLYFPHLTETFIANEIHALKSLGHRIRIVSLLRPKKTPVQPLSKSLLHHAVYAPGLWSRDFWNGQVYFLLRSGSLYFRMLRRILAGPANSGPVAALKRLIIFFKSVAVAYQLRGSEVDVFHSHFAWLAGEGGWICSQLRDRPFTVTIHAFDIFTKTDLMELVVSEANHIVSISEYNRNHIRSLNLSSEKKVSVIHCGVDLADFRYQEGQAHASRPQKQIKILSVGSLTEKKGHAYLIEACRLLEKKGEVDFTCTIIGGGREMPHLRHQIDSGGIEKKVFLAGSLTSRQIQAAYRENDIFVLASVVAESGDRDGIPVVLMEAAAMGVPMVSTRVSGIPELVRHGETGLLVPPADSEALAEAITDLAGNPDLRKRLIRNARKLVEIEFDQRVSAGRLIEVFNDVIAAYGAKT